MVIFILFLTSFNLFAQNLKDDGTPYFVPQRANVFIDEPKFGNFFIKFENESLPEIIAIGNESYNNSYRYDCIGNSVISNYNSVPINIFSINNIYDNKLNSLDFFAVETKPYEDFELTESKARNNIAAYTLNKNALTLESIKYKFVDINPQRSIQLFTDNCEFSNFISDQGDIDFNIINSKLYISPGVYYIFEKGQYKKHIRYFSYIYNKKYNYKKIDNSNNMKKLENPFKNITTMLTAVQNEDKNSQFLIYHTDSTDYFSVHRVNDKGDLLNEKRNTIGVDYTKPYRNGDTNDVEKGLYYNYLKASPNGKVLAQTQLWGEIMDLETLKFDTWVNGFEKRNFYLFKFNNSNGDITDEIIMNRTAHSMEFSPNSRYLYITSIDGMYVYDLIEWDRDKIIQSEKKIDDFGLWSTVYMGPYGKLWGFNYMSDTLLCFPSPNDFENLTLEKYSVLDIKADNPQSKVTLSNLMKSGSWLPIMPNNIHHYPINEYYNNINISLFGEGKYCLNDSLELNAETENYNNDMLAYWVKPNGEQVFNNTLKINSLSALDSGLYIYYLESECDGSLLSDSIVIDVYNLDPKITTSQNNFCVGDSAILSLNFNYDNILWNTGESSNTISVKDAGVYSATVSQNDCVNYIDFEIKTLPIPEIEFIAPNGTILCDGSSLEIEAKVADKIGVTWSDGTKIKKRTFSESGTFTVTARDITTGCENTKSIVILDMGDSNPQILGDNSFCEGESTTLTIDAQAKSYIWNNGKQSQSIEVDKAGLYSATITTDNGCELTSEIEVMMYKKPEFTILGDSVICDNEIILSADKDFEVYKWSNGENSKSITIDKAGIYELTVIDLNACKTSKSIEIKRNVPDINLSDDFIDFGEVLFGDSKVENVNSDVDINIIKNDDNFDYEYNNRILNLSFTPQNIGEFKDTILVESKGDCVVYDTIIVTGIGKAEILAKISNSEGYAGDTINTLVELELLQQIPLPIKFNYNLSLEINQNAIQIIDNTTFDYLNDKLIINIDDIINQDKYNSEIKNISSQLQSPELSENHIVIKKFTVENIYLIPQTQDGLIKILESNQNDDYKAAEIINLTKTNLTLKTFKKGKYKIEISDLLGKVIHDDEQVNNNETIKFNYDLINGTYFIKITDPDKSTTIKVNFVE